MVVPSSAPRGSTAARRPHLWLIPAALVLVSAAGACGGRSPQGAPPANPVARASAVHATSDAVWGGVPAGSLFNRPSGVAVDGRGNLYVADTGRDRILKFAPDGRPAGGWDGGPAGTRLRGPQGLAIDAAGFVFVADTGNHRVVKFSPAGTPLASWGSGGGDDGELNSPAAVAVDPAGNLYVADTKNHRVQKFGASGRFLTAWGGYGFSAGQFNAPGGIAVDRSGAVYAADTWNHRVQKFDGRGRYLLEWGALGRGSGRFNTPTGIAVDAAGRVYVVSAGLQPVPSRDLADVLRVQRVQVFTEAGTFLRAWGRAGSAPGLFDRAAALAVDHAGNVYAADTENHRVQKFTPAGTPVRQWGTLPPQVLKSPSALAVDSGGSLYVADQGNFRVVRVDRTGSPTAVWRFPDTAAFEDVAVDASGNLIVALTDGGVPLVRKLSPSGERLAELRGLAAVKGVAVDGRGQIYVSDWRSGEIRLFTAGGAPAGRWPVDFPGDIAVDRAGNVYGVERGQHRVVKWGAQGKVLATWGAQGSGEGQFQDGTIAVDPYGRVYLADPVVNRVLVFAPGGAFLGKWGVWGAGRGQLYQPRAVAVDQRGRVYVAEPLLDRVQVFTVSGLPD